MNEQTKKLDLALSKLNFKVGNNLQHLSPITRGEIMQVCRDAGLDFVDFGLPCAELGQTCEHRITGIEL